MAQRRTHKKSKLGCQSCKQRHIKCDEGRPACANCTSTERQCMYLPPRPRRVRSSSPRTTLNASAVSATESPLQSLLNPISGSTQYIAHEDSLAGAAATSTPSSFATSSLFTPTPSLQYSAASSSVNTRHMELMSHFLLETGPSLDLRGVFGFDLMRIIMPAVLSAPYLLLQALALSALHLAHSRPAQADTYHADATSLQIEALTAFDDHLGNIDNTNCEAMLMFAATLGMHSLGEAVMASKNDPNGFLDRFVTYLNLHRGVQTVTSQAWELLLHSRLSPILHYASSQLQTAALHAPERAAFVEEELSRLLDNGDMSLESDTACRDAVSRLKLMYQVDYLEDQSLDMERRSSGLIWAWPTLLSGVYTGLLQKRQPEALIILCYYAVLLHQQRSTWSVGKAGCMLIESVTKSLGSYWRQWLEWPNEAIEET